ncbi:hypothetical protein [Oleidesulfovibrio alaskensis]|uniref:hypothetical protein n=1 Tax=Oleidesulfovibrio alaskensis TaxID=58180 RepID=UPI000404ABCA|nr:hypothetical protein [Oleidesulfovibrio alaskensis]
MKQYRCPIIGAETTDQRPAAADCVAWWWVVRLLPDGTALVACPQVSPQQHAALLAAGCTEVPTDG